MGHISYLAQYNHISMLTDKQKQAIRDMYFADCPITVLDNPPQEVVDYYYSLMQEYEQDLPPFEPCVCADDDDELPW